MANFISGIDGFFLPARMIGITISVSDAAYSEVMYAKSNGSWVAMSKVYKSCILFRNEAIKQKRETIY